MKLNKNNKRIVNAILSSIINKKYIDNEVIDLYESEINDGYMLTLEKEDSKVIFTKLMTIDKGVVIRIQNRSYEKCIVVDGDDDPEIFALINEVFAHDKKFIDNSDVDNVENIMKTILN